MKSVIFDLDLTLVDTTKLAPLRKARKWNDVYSMISSTVLYEGMRNVLDIIRDKHIKVAIVSTAPKTYIEKIVEFHNIPVNYIIGFYDASPIKPNPAPMLKALELLGVSAKETISFGDRVIDIQSSNSAGIESVACFWGTMEKAELIKSQYSHAILHPNEILTLIR